MLVTTNLTQILTTAAVTSSHVYLQDVSTKVVTTTLTQLLRRLYFPELEYDCDGNCLEDSDGDGIEPFEIAGCTDPTALNYDETKLTMMVLVSLS